MRLRRLARRHRVHWLAAVALAVITAWLVGTTLARADAARRRWGADRAVAVATRRLEPGAVVRAGDVRVQRWPAALVPDGALAAAPVGRTVIAEIVPGEAMVDARLAPGGVHGLAALVPKGWRALAIPIGSDGLRVQPGDLVDLLATLDPVAAGGSGDEPALAVAQSAVVLTVDERTVTVAVPADDATRVAFALSSGTVTLALRAPG